VSFGNGSLLSATLSSLSSREAVTSFDFAQKWVAVDGDGGLSTSPRGPNNRRFLWQRSSPFSNPLLFVIPSARWISYFTALTSDTCVVLLKENHMRFVEDPILDRKSGGAEGSAVRHSGAPNLPFHNYFPFVILEDGTATARPVAMINDAFARRFFKTKLSGKKSTGTGLELCSKW
jgi:hypothetical protein